MGTFAPTIPAQLTTTSTAPIEVAACATAAASVTSRARSAPGAMSSVTTSRPSARSRTADAAPRPLAPPVTTARRIRDLLLDRDVDLGAVAGRSGAVAGEHRRELLERHREADERPRIDGAGRVAVDRAVEPLRPTEDADDREVAERRGARVDEARLMREPDAHDASARLDEVEGTGRHRGVVGRIDDAVPRAGRKRLPRPYVVEAEPPAERDGPIRPPDHVHLRAVRRRERGGEQADGSGSDDEQPLSGAESCGTPCPQGVAARLDERAVGVVERVRDRVQRAHRDRDPLRQPPPPPPPGPPPR